MDIKEREILFQEWMTGKPKLPRGILVGCNAKQEWMLPWWWSHYSVHNKFPVFFIDFGMTDSALAWCRQRGECFHFEKPLDFIVTQEKIPKAIQSVWQNNFLSKDFWEQRNVWYKKPFAMLKSPFDQTIWTDLDCEIRGDLTALFETCCNPAGLAIAPEPKYSNEAAIKCGILQPGEVNYNAGVVVYAHGSELMLKWAKLVIDRNADFSGDQDVLAWIIRNEKAPIYELPQIYNWRMAAGPNPEALIVHWVSDPGKRHIRKQMIMGNS